MQPLSSAQTSPQFQFQPYSNTLCRAHRPKPVYFLGSNSPHPVVDAATRPLGISVSSTKNKQKKRWESIESVRLDSDPNWILGLLQTS